MPDIVASLPNVFASPGILKCSQSSQYMAWIKSRSISGQSAYLIPGAQRQISLTNAALAYEITIDSGTELMKELWALEPYRITVMLSLEVIRGVFPAMRCYSQALLVDEVHTVYKVKTKNG